MITDSRGTVIGPDNGKFVTDEDGRIVIRGLDIGVTIKAQETKAAEGYALDGSPKTIAIRKGDAQTLTFFNEPKQSVIIQKFIDGTTKPLAGVTFLVTDSAGNRVGEYVTDQNGQITISGLNPGTVLIAREVRTVKGYVLNGTPQTITVGSGTASLMTVGSSSGASGAGGSASGGSGNTLTFYDEPLSTLVVHKYISGTDNEPLSGVEFKITDGAGKALGTSGGLFTTDATGTITVENIEPGTTVKVQEVRTVDGFVLDGTPQTVKIESSDVHELTFRNQRQGSLTVKKQDSVTGVPLSGAEFKITYADGRVVDTANGQISSAGTYVTNERGEIVISGVTGTIVVTEVKAPQGYTINPDARSQTVEVRPNDGQTLVFKNDPTQTLTIQKFIAGTTDPLPGVEFLVRDSGGEYVGPDGGRFVTDEHGQIVISGLVPGVTITAKETKTVSGYVLDSTPQSIKIKSGEAQTLAFYNAPKGSLLVRKIDSVTEQPLSGAEFKITTLDGTPVADNEGRTSTNGIYRTDGHGEIVLLNVQPGTYRVAETAAPEGYVLNTEAQTVTVSANDSQTLTFKNVPLQTLRIQKYAAGTTTPLSGVTFHVTDADGANIGTNQGNFVTDERGQILITGLTPGVTITARETETISGYVLDSTPQTVKIKSGDAQTLTYYNAPKGTITVRKLDSVTEQPLSGAEFKITTLDGTPVDDNEGRTSTGGIYRTDENGEIVLLNLQPGTYRVAETKAPEGYVLDAKEQTVKVNAKDHQTLTFKDAPLESVTIRKYIDGTTKPLAGVTFQVTDAAGTLIGEYVTDQNGEIVISGLVPGTTIIAREIRTVKGYVLNGTPQTITVGGTAKRGLLSLAGALFGTSGTSTASGGNVLTFYDEPLSTLVVHKYVDGTDNEPLSGVEFKITDGAGKALGTTGGLFTTDATGTITVENIEPGTTVKVQEVKTVPGYVLDGRPQTVRIESSDVHELTFRNQRQGLLTVKKQDSVTGAPLSGVEFKITYADGRVVDTANGQISSAGTYVTNERGEIVISGVTGTIVVTEVKAAPGYTINPDSRSQTVEVRPNDGQTLVFKNDPTQTLTIQKFVTGTTDPLPGVEFLVRDSGGAYIGPDKGRFVTDANGQIVISGLVPGVTITAKETKTISGYVLDSTPQSIKIQSGEAQTLTFFNTPKGTLTVRKIDSVTEEPLSGAEFKITTLDGTVVDDNEGRTSTGGIYRTDANGEIVLAKLQPGGYRITETKAPEGYVLNTEAQTVTVNANDHQTVTFKNTALQSVTIQKYIEGTTKPLAGVTFLITDAAGTPVGGGNGEYVTDANGRITISGLVPGTTLIAREIRTVKGYVLNGNPQTIVVGTSGGAASSAAGTDSGAAAASGTGGNTLTFYDGPLSTLVIHKYVTGTDNTPLSGVEFKITDASGAAVGNGTYYTDRSGEIKVENLEPGQSVTVRETKTVSGYVLDGTPQTAKIPSGDVLDMVFWNARQGGLTIVKQDSVTREPIPGTEFSLKYADGRPVDTENGQLSSGGSYVTDEHGEIHITGFTGTVVITEEKPAPGYTVNPDGRTKTVTVNPGETQTVTFANAPSQTLTISKYETGTTKPIQGAAFLVTAGNGAAVGDSDGEFVTDANGRIVISGLTPGTTVTVKEIRAARGYVLDGSPKTITIRSGAAQSLTFYNSPEQTLTLRKFVTGTTTPIPGAAFMVTDQTGAPVGEANGEYVTDENGTIVLSGLTPGTVITAKETRAADGYALDASPKSITIKAGAAQSLNFYNSPTGTLIVVKRDKATEKPLKGAVFQILTADGKYVPNAGGQLSSNGSYTTDDKGQIIITGLSTDTLIVKETKAPSGYILDDTPQTVKVGPNDTQTLTFYDAPEKNLTIQKYVTGTTDPIPGVTFLLTDSTGATIGPDQGEYTTDRNGRITITGLTPGTTITAKEIRTVDGYVLDTKPQSITIKEGAGQTLTFYNEPVGGLELIKVDAADKTIRIPNTTFEVRSMNVVFYEGGR